MALRYHHFSSCNNQRTNPHSNTNNLHIQPCVIYFIRFCPWLQNSFHITIHRGNTVCHNHKPKLNHTSIHTPLKTNLQYVFLLPQGNKKQVYGRRRNVHRYSITDSFNIREQYLTGVIWPRGVQSFLAFKNFSILGYTRKS